MEPDLQHTKIFATPDGLIAQWDEGAEALFGYTAEEAVGQSLDLVIPPEYRERHWIGFNRALATDGVTINKVGRSVPTVPKSGVVTQRAVRLIVLPDNNDKAVGAIAIFSPMEEPQA